MENEKKVKQFIVNNEISEAILFIQKLIDQYGIDHYNHAIPLIEHCLHSRRHKGNIKAYYPVLEQFKQFLLQEKMQNYPPALRDYILTCMSMGKDLLPIDILNKSFAALEKYHHISERTDQESLCLDIALANIAKMRQYIRHRMPHLVKKSAIIEKKYYDLYQIYQHQIELTDFAQKDYYYTQQAQKPQQSVLSKIKNIFIGAQKKSHKPLKELKVALCLSGQMRGYEHVFRNTYQNIINQYNTDVFIHTWGNTGNRIPKEKRHIKHFLRVFPEAFCHALEKNNLLGLKIYNRYPLLKQEIFAGEDVTHENLKNIYGQNAHIVIENEQECQHIFDKIEHLSNWQAHLNQARMYYKIYACNQLKIAQEKHQGFQYDIVIRMRPDQLVKQPLDPQSLYHAIDNPHVIYNDGIFAYYYGDILAYGSSNAMDHYAHLWQIAGSLTETMTMPNFRKRIAGHFILYDYLYYAHYDILHSPNYEILDLTSKKIDCDTLKNIIHKTKQPDFDKIDKILLEVLTQKVIT